LGPREGRVAGFRGLVQRVVQQADRGLGQRDPAALADRAGVGDLVQPGPTKTNVNDCRIILVG
ncbi:hypothetical protein FV223_21835, partial [Methylobacterium sp. WL116]